MSELAIARPVSVAISVGLLTSSWVGCAFDPPPPRPPTISFTPAGPGAPVRSARPLASIELYMEPSRPRCAVEITGLVESTGHPTMGKLRTSQECLDDLRTQAATRGFDGILEASCATPGTVGHGVGTCQGKTYVCK